MKIIIGQDAILTDKEVYYKDSVLFPVNTNIPTDADYVKVLPDVSEDFLNEIKKFYPYENDLFIGMGIEKHYNVKLFKKVEPKYVTYENINSDPNPDEDIPDF